MSKIFQSKYPRRTRTIFLSLPHKERVIRFCNEILIPQIENQWPRLKVVSYLSLNHGRWMNKIEKMISFSNVVVAILDELNSSVLFEIGQAVALGKPIVLLSPENQELPAMLKHNQIIFFKEKEYSQIKISRILEAISESVFSALNREKSDKRTQIQKELLVGERKNVLIDERIEENQKSIFEKGEDFEVIRAETAFYNGDFHKVAEMLESFLKKGNIKEEVYHLLADNYFLWSEGEMTDAFRGDICKRMLQVTNEGLINYPESFLLRKDRGLALMRNYLPGDAKEQFEQLYEINPKIPFVPYNLACTHAALLEVNTAIKYLREAIDLRPDYQELARVDSDFDPIWDDVLFQALIFKYKN